MSMAGLEPATPRLSPWYSPAELHAQVILRPPLAGLLRLLTTKLLADVAPTGTLLLTTGLSGHDLSALTVLRHLE